MKVIILAGGFGTRLPEYTSVIPKPMVPVGGHPLLWHIMNIYAHYGFKDFLVALGYKAEVKAPPPEWRWLQLVDCKSTSRVVAY